MDQGEADRRFYELIAEAIDNAQKMNLPDLKKQQIASEISKQVEIYETKKKYAKQMAEALDNLERNIIRLNAAVEKNKEIRDKVASVFRRASRNLEIAIILQKEPWYDKNLSSIAGNYAINSAYDMRMHKLFYAIVEGRKELSMQRDSHEDYARAEQDMESYNESLRKEQKRYVDKLVEENLHIVN